MRPALVEESISAPIDEVERLFRAHHGLVFRTAYRITGNATDAEDVLQTIFLRLVKRDASAPPLENSETYLRRAAINAALDVIRARRTAETVSSEWITAYATLLERLPRTDRQRVAEALEVLARALDGEAVE